MRTAPRLLLPATPLLPIRPRSLDARDAHVALLRGGFRARLEVVARDCGGAAELHSPPEVRRRAAGGGS